MDDIQSRVHAFITDTFPVDETIAAGDNLFDKGIVDSIGVLTLVTWMEQEFGFLVHDEEVVPENLESIDALVRYIDGKLASGEAEG